MQISLYSLQMAWLKVKTKTKVAGIDGITTDWFASNSVEYLKQIKNDLDKNTYEALAAKGLYLPKKSGGNRLIGIPAVKDRVIQRWLLKQIYPILDTVYSNCSYAYRPGIGVAAAIKHFAAIYQHQSVWIVKADIANFFENLCWAILLNELEKLQLGSPVISLIEQQLKALIVINGYSVSRNQGVIQGGILSGALANLYLSDFDYRCLDAGIELIRYGDDFVIASQSLLEATRYLHWLQQWLNDLYLELHPQKTQIIAPDESFTFLGYQCQGGEIIAPISKQKPQSSNKSSPKVIVESRPPRVCNISATKNSNSRRNKHHWHKSMTTLYVTEQGAYLKVKQKQFQVMYQGNLLCQVPVNLVSHVVLFGCCNLSHGTVSLALQRRIPIMYLSSRGKYFGRLATNGMAEVEYLTKQVECSLNPDFRLTQAKSIVEAKLHNSRILLQRLYRRRKVKESPVKEAIANLAELRDKIETIESVESLLGYEGQGAHVYFQALGHLLQEPFVFTKRVRRPPTDPINSLLSLGYTLLHHNLYSLVQAVGLHTHFGNLHVPRRNHPALVSDLIEEWRAPIVDSLVAYLINSKIFQPSDFTPPDEGGGVYLFPDALKKFLKHWEDKLNTSITHPHTNNKVNYRRCLELQVWEYINCLEGKQPIYRPMRFTK